jgi:hypothetical protein
MYLQQKTPSSHDGFVRLYNWPCSTDVPIASTVAKSTLFAFFTGVYLCAVFSSKPSMQMLCFRVENGLHEEKQKSRLKLHPGEGTTFFKGSRDTDLNGFNLLSFTTTVRIMQLLKPLSSPSVFVGHSQALGLLVLYLFQSSPKQDL